jgi:predicted metal-dependent phosphoesterase TrpH
VLFTDLVICRSILQVMNENNRADLHVHSAASELSKLGIQRSLHLPECATAPEEVYELAKRRGMDFVTITDQDTIAGALAIQELPGTFISEELTAWFSGEPQAVHVLCYGITPDDHDWLQAHRADVETCAEYLAAHAAALADPFYAVEAPLSARHRRRLAELFPIWETRNGARAKELNLPAFFYIETHGGTAIGGSDDHAGIDIGRTFTETPLASSPEEFLGHIRSGDASAHGAQGSAAMWTHAAMALAIRSLGAGAPGTRPDPAAVLKIVERVMREDLEVDAPTLLARLQNGELSHPDLYRRARRIHERKLAGVVDGVVAMSAGEARLELGAAAVGLFDACVPAISYAAATAFLGREKLKLTRSDGDRPRVALVADGLGGVHGVTHTVQQIRERGVPGFEVEVIGTDADVDLTSSCSPARLTRSGRCCSKPRRAVCPWSRSTPAVRRR